MNFSLSTTEHINYSRPSIDVLFETAADVYSEKLIAIILTGANEDGCNGLKKIKKKGGYTIAQDPETAESKYMPKCAIDKGIVDTILPLESIGPFVLKIITQNNQDAPKTKKIEKL